MHDAIFVKCWCRLIRWPVFAPGTRFQAALRVEPRDLVA